MSQSFWMTGCFAAFVFPLVFLFATTSAFLVSLERKTYNSGVLVRVQEDGDR
jgi:hypothetical protein